MKLLYYRNLVCALYIHIHGFKGKTKTTLFGDIVFVSVPLGNITVKINNVIKYFNKICLINLNMVKGMQLMNGSISENYIGMLLDQYMENKI